MPGVKKAGSVRAVDFIKTASPETKTALLGILSEDEESLSFRTVNYFRNADVNEARAVLDIVSAELKDREPDSAQKKGATKRRDREQAAVTENAPDPAKSKK